jgi:hypothetical protein
MATALGVIFRGNRASPVTGVEEVFDVQVLLGTVARHISGPWADRDTDRQLWTVLQP